MSDDWEISVLGLKDEDYDQATEASGARGWLTPGVETSLARNTIKSEKLQEKLRDFLNAMQGVIGDVPDYLGQFQLSEVTLSAEISASGKISLIGSGAELGGAGGITFKLTRKPDL